MKEKISVTRGLSTLQLLEKKIEKATQQGEFITYKIGNDIDSKKDHLAAYQSVQDLIAYRQSIKFAITASNSKTQITVAGKTMTVAEAIDTKNAIVYKVDFLDKLKKERYRVTGSVEDINENVNFRLDKLIESSVGNEKSSKSEIEAISKPFLARNAGSVVDVLDIDKKITDLENEIDDFTNDIDIELSESNSKTLIEV